MGKISRKLSEEVTTSCFKAKVLNSRLPCNQKNLLFEYYDYLSNIYSDSSVKSFVKLPLIFLNTLGLRER